MAAEVATHLKVQSVEPVSESPFYIPMTGPAARPRRGPACQRTSAQDHGESSTSFKAEVTTT
jgi:hypothetical protein